MKALSTIKVPLFIKGCICEGAFIYKGKMKIGLQPNYTPRLFPPEVVDSIRHTWCTQHWPIIVQMMCLPHAVSLPVVFLLLFNLHLALYNTYIWLLELQYALLLCLVYC